MTTVQEERTIAMHKKQLLGKSFSEIAAEFGITRNVCQGRVHRYRKQLEDDHRDLEICREIDEGRSTGAIANHFEVPLGHVQELKRSLSEVD